MSLSIAIVGAGRSHQGLGPFMARMVASAGHRVTAVVGRSVASAKVAAAELSDERSELIRGFDCAEQLVAEARPDAWMIASPYASHEGYLEVAAGAALPTLCEKPFVWTDAEAGPGPDAGPGARAAQLWQRFTDNGVLLRENVQWPYTLPAYRSLFPEVDLDRASRFDFELAPESDGPARLIDSLSHVLSLVQEVRPGAERVEAIEISTSEPVQVRFRVVGQALPLSVNVSLGRVPQPPRPAAYGFDGHLAHRVIEPETYSMRFEAVDRPSVPVPDPMNQLISAFLGEVEAGTTRPDPRIPIRMRMLEELVAAYPRSS